MFKIKRIFAKIVDLVLFSTTGFCWNVLFSIIFVAMIFTFGLIDVEIFLNAPSMQPEQMVAIIEQLSDKDYFILMSTSLFAAFLGSVVNSVVYFGVAGVVFKSTPGKMLLNLNIESTNEKPMNFGRYIISEPLVFIQYLMFLALLQNILGVICYVLILVYYFAFSIGNKYVHWRFNTKVV